MGKKQETKVEKPVVKTTEKRQLKCMLTDAELLEAGGTLAQAQQRIVELEAELQAFKDDNKGKVALAEAEMTRNSNLVRQKYAWRDVPCEVVKDYNYETVTIKRKDTGEIVDNRRMTDAELSELPLADERK